MGHWDHPSNPRFFQLDYRRFHSRVKLQSLAALHLSRVLLLVLTSSGKPRLTLSISPVIHFWHVINVSRRWWRWWRRRRRRRLVFLKAWRSSSVVQTTFSRWIFTQQNSGVRVRAAVKVPGLTGVLTCWFSHCWVKIWLNFYEQFYRWLHSSRVFAAPPHLKWV